jgi:hypothetical protein
MCMEQSMLPALLMSDSPKGNNGKCVFFNIFSADKHSAEKKVGLMDWRECGGVEYDLKIPSKKSVFAGADSIHWKLNIRSVYFIQTL